MKETIKQLEVIAGDHEKKAAGLRKHIEGLRALVNGAAPKKKRRGMSPEARQKIAEAQKRRWANKNEAEEKPVTKKRGKKALTGIGYDPGAEAEAV